MNRGSIVDRVWESEGSFWTPGGMCRTAPPIHSRKMFRIAFSDNQLHDR